MTYACPVCGFDQMPFPPSDNNICSCCGTEFEYHDVAKSHQILRRAWMANGCPWFSSAILPPVDWNPYVQMLNAGLVDVTVGGKELSLVIEVCGVKVASTASRDVGTIGRAA